MEISFQDLVNLIAEAYEAGCFGCTDLKQQNIDLLLNKYNIVDINDFKVWKVSKLLNMPDGTLFQHITKGRCWIASRSNGAKFMQFNNGQSVGLLSDVDPWDKPMKLINRN